MARFNIPGVTRQRRKDKRPKVVKFVPVHHIFKAQRQIRMLRDVSGWVNNDKMTGRKWHFSTGKMYFVDDETADSFIIKGYADGQLSREYSEGERSEILSTVTHISLPIGGASNG